MKGTWPVSCPWSPWSRHRRRPSSSSPGAGRGRHGSAPSVASPPGPSRRRGGAPSTSCCCRLAGSSTGRHREPRGSRTSRSPIGRTPRSPTRPKTARSSGGSTSSCLSCARRSTNSRGWHPDPLHQRGFRFFDGQRWTRDVTDDPARKAAEAVGDARADLRRRLRALPPPPDSAPSWHVDPLGKGHYRYFDGWAWTDKVHEARSS